MPKPIFHLWIARQLAMQHPLLHTPDFYLGHIAPDAALSRKDPPENFKNRTHLTASTADKDKWTQSVCDYYASLTSPSPFDIGYCMHVLTDIEFRKFMRRYYEQLDIPSAEHEAYDKVIMPLMFSQLFDTEGDFLKCVHLAKNSTLTEFPFSITREEMIDNIRFAEHSYPYTDINFSPTIPVPNARKLGAEIIRVLLQKAPL